MMALIQHVSKFGGGAAAPSPSYTVNGEINLLGIGVFRCCRLV
jgi:hypothetical protein